MVIDIQDWDARKQLAMRLQDRAYTLQLAAIPHHDEVVVQGRVRLASKAVHAGQKFIHGRNRIRTHGRGHSPTRLDQERMRQGRSERVGFGVLMADRQDAARST